MEQIYWKGIIADREEDYLEHVGQGVDPGRLLLLFQHREAVVDDHRSEGEGKEGQSQEEARGRLRAVDPDLVLPLGVDGTLAHSPDVPPNYMHDRCRYQGIFNDRRVHRLRKIYL